jgi:capsular polysaccharide biosynthesis protein
LRRGNTGAPRLVRNEDEIVTRLIKRGFVVIDVGSDTLGHLIGTLFNAKIVVSMEGSHIAHCIYSSPKNSALLVLQPSDRFASIHRSWSASSGLRFGFVVGSRSDAGYYFPVSDILRTIDLLSAQIDT